MRGESAKQARGEREGRKSYGLVYVYSEDGKLYALDARTGGSRWIYFIGGISSSSFLIDSSPVVIQGMVYIGSRDHKVFAFHLAA